MNCVDQMTLFATKRKKAGESALSLKKLDNSLIPKKLDYGDKVQFRPYNPPSVFPPLVSEELLIAEYEALKRLG